MLPQCRAVAGSDTGSEILHYRVTGFIVSL